MSRTMMVSALLLALAAGGCDGEGEVDGGVDGSTPGDGGDTVDGGVDAGDPGDGGGPDATPMGDATLTFTPTWGNADDQFQGLNWQAILDLNIFQPAIEENRDTRIVIMLCGTSDTTCESPVLTREVAAEETDGDPIQDSFGPDVAVSGLPSGTYALMVFADTGVSRAHELAWDDDFDTNETAWGGVVSELDVMLSEEPTTGGFTPPPATLEITLTDGATTELGTLTLQHVHERDISPPPNAEAGTMAVAVADGVRLIDTNTNTVLETAPGSGFYTRVMADGGGNPFAGTVCGMIDGPDDSVFVMFNGGGVGAGFAVQYDIAADTQMNGSNRVVFPDAGLPCRGRYHDGYLYVTNASASRMNVEEAAAQENLWVADLAGLTSGDVDATVLDRTNDPILQHGVDDLVAVGSTMYLTLNGDDTAGGLPAACVGSYCVFSAAIGSDGLPTLNDGGYTHWEGPAIGAAYPTPMGNVTCLEVASPWAAIEVAEFHDGRTLLFLGACNEVAVFDTADGSRIDLGAGPGTQGIDGTLFGQAFNAFALSPDGETLWALPQLKSPIPFNLASGVDDSRAEFNRYMALPIDLTTGSQPALDAAFSGDDIDGYEGSSLLSPYMSPANDPGVDINLGGYTAYRRELLPSTTGFQPAAIPFGPSVVATNASLWVRGSGNAAAGASGLGKSGNLAVYDLEEREMILFPYDDADFYRFWHGGAEGRPEMGFDITPESGEPVATFGLRWIPG